ncbi:MAG: hypothetical protein A2V77_22855 [Anaeromyxobacter sp. RBG_16_69_14]|nr:MAG: hypothetical protein A2V77_22855 [Anaeromyxobacter sp. RBG_16_69_14]
MSDRIVVGKSAQEFFRELVSDALSHRRLQIQEATEFYLVNLLAQHLQEERLLARVEGGEAQAEPLALILKRALEGDREARWRNLKRLGDTSLFVSGFFGDSLARSLVDIDYYIAMGERAYDALSEEPRGPSGAQELFAELAERFPQFVDLFAEIAELADLGSNRGLLRLYERFLLTGSERVAQRLRERGVALFGGPGRPRSGPFKQ